MKLLKSSRRYPLASEQAQKEMPCLAQVAEELCRLLKGDDELKAMLSHELRTPLVTGIGYIELLLEGAYGPLSPRAEARMSTALKNLQRLSRQIEVILEHPAAEILPKGICSEVSIANH